MTKTFISGSGLFTPSESISNAELVASYNQYVEDFNRAHAADIEAGRTAALSPSNEEFIRDRDSHFIFGDACTALVIEREDTLSAAGAFEIIGTKLQTQFSNNIRNDAGFLNRAEAPARQPAELLFRQQRP